MSSSNYATAALVESAHGWLVHRCHHRPPLPRECDHRDDEPHGGGGVEPGRGLIQHQQLMPDAVMPPNTPRTNVFLMTVSAHATRHSTSSCAMKQLGHDTAERPLVNPAVATRP
jgi:hypothetical protein